MKRKLLLAGAIASFLALASGLNGPANAQIGIGRTDSELTLSGQLSIADGTVNDPSIVFTSDDDGSGTGIFRSAANTIGFTTNGVRVADFTTGGLELINGSVGIPAMSFSGDNDTGIFQLVGGNHIGFASGGVLVFDIEDTNAATAGANLTTVSATLGIMDGSDTVNGLSIELTNTDHTGSSNIVNGINIAAITGDAQASERAILVSDGWDKDLAFVGTTKNFQMGTGFNSTLSIGDDSAVVALLLSGITSILPTVDVQGHLRIDGSFIGLEVSPISVGIMDGSDTFAFVKIASANGNHTGTGNTLNLIEIAALTGDANANLNAILIGALTGTVGAASETEYAINIGAGWDTGIAVNTVGTAALPAITFREVDDGFFSIGTNNLGLSMNAILVMDWEDTNLAGASANLVTISAALGIMDGSDTFNGLSLDLTNANHTSTSNVVNAINIAGITGDADATENAIIFGTGWDADIEATTSFDITIDGDDFGSFRIVTGTFTATQVRKLNATPIEVIAASGAGTAIIIQSVRYMLDWNSVAYDSVGSSEDLVIGYASGASANIMICDNASCLDADATADAFGITRIGDLLGEILGDRAVNISMTGGEWAAADDDANGDSPVHYIIRYRVVTTDLS